MANDIKQRIVLEGEKEYSQALKDAQRNLKVLRSELKAETAELGRNATEQQKNETRVKNLQKQIKEQEKVVKTYEKALAEVREKYSDNEEAIAKWETKLNDARTALANMKNGLEDTGKAMQSVGNSAQQGVVAANAFADSLGKIAGVGDSVSSAIEGAFMGIVGHISDAISLLWGQLMDVSARANNWTDIANMWGTSAGTIQKWYHAVGAEAKDFSDLSNKATKIITADQKKVAEATGVTLANYEDQWEGAMAVMDSLSKMDRDAQMNALETMGIKGAKQEGWLDMLGAWTDIRGNLGKFDAENGGIGLTDEDLEKADRLSKDVALLKESWMALKDHALVNLFGDLALNITGNLQNIVEAFHEYFSAEDDAGRQAALDKIKKNIEEAFETIKGAIENGIRMLGELAENLKKSDDPAVQAFGTLLEKIVNVLQWFADESNWETVKRGFEALIAVWAGGKVLKAIANVASFASHVKTIMGGGKKLFNLGGGSGGGAGSGAAGGTAGGGGLLGGIKAKAGGLWGNLKAGYAANGAWGMAPAAVLAAAITPAIIEQNKALDRIRQEQNHMEESADKMAEAGDVNADFVKKSAAAWGLKKNGNGEELKNVLGFGYTQMDDEYGDLLMGLRHRKGAEMAKLQLALNGKQTATGDDAWLALNRLWNGEMLDQQQTDALLKTVTDSLIYQGQHGVASAAHSGPVIAHNGKFEYGTGGAYITQDDGSWYHMGYQVPSDWWLGGKNSDDALKRADVDSMNKTMQGLPKSMANAMSGVRVIMDGAVVGNLVAPYVSQQIARDTQ